MTEVTPVASPLQGFLARHAEVEGSIVYVDGFARVVRHTIIVDGGTCDQCARARLRRGGHHCWNTTYRLTTRPGYEDFVQEVTARCSDNCRA